MIISAVTRDRTGLLAACARWR